MPRVVLALLLCASAAAAGDWTHWRGPLQTGQANETLPDAFDLAEPGKGNLLWKQPFGGRSAPLILKGRVYTLSGYDANLPTEGERVMCFDADTGKVLWEKKFNVFHTDIVSSRLGWTTLTADPEKEYVYVHTTSGFLTCYDKDGGTVWQRQLTEEFGRVSGYGGRITSPIFDSGLVIVGMLQASWGDFARGGNRFAAFDGNTGEIVWWADTVFPLKSTYICNPVVAVIGGQRQLIGGGGDGYLHGIQVRTGKVLWSFPFAVGPVNPSPVVAGNLVYCSHGEPNFGGGPEGRVVCLDPTQLDAAKKPKLVWEFKRSNRFGLSSPALADGRLYCPDDGSEMFCFNAKTGKVLWRKKYGTVARGAPLIAGGKLYVFDVFAKLAVWKLNGDEEPTEDQEFAFRPKVGTSVVETHGTPVAVDGRLYFLTRDDIYCVGPVKGVAGPGYKPQPPEPAFDPKAGPAAIRVIPADILAKSGSVHEFRVAFLDAQGRVLPEATGDVEWSLPAPPLPPPAPGAPPPATPPTGPPPLRAELKPEGAKVSVTLAKPPPPVQQGNVLAKVGTLTAKARVRVPGAIPFTTDFQQAPPGAAPGGWINGGGKFTFKKIGDNIVLSKVNTNSNALVAKAAAYLTPPDSTDYTIECDLMGGKVRDKMPDMGLINSRYTLVFDGKNDPATGKRSIKLSTWDAMPRLNKSIVYEWEPDVWYRAKFTVSKGAAMGKVWKKADPEPAEWTVSFEDPSPNKEGAAGIYGYVSNILGTDQPGSEIYYDNLSIKPNK